MPIICLCRRRVNRTGCDIVDFDAVLHPLASQRLRQVLDAGPGRARVRHAGHAHSIDRHNVDNVAAVFFHVLVECLVHHVPRAIQIRVNYGMETFLANVFGPGVELPATIIHQAVQLAKSLQGSLDQLGAGVAIANVGDTAKDLGPVDTVLLELDDGMLDALGVARGDDDLDDIVVNSVLETNHLPLSRVEQAPGQCRAQCQSHRR